MDPIKNPFSPGAGSPPSELAGRAPILEQARILRGRVLLDKPEKSLMLTGLRGVGKTALLNEVRRMAQGSENQGRTPFLPHHPATETLRRTVANFARCAALITFVSHSPVRRD